MAEKLGTSVLDLKTDATGLVRGLREGKRGAEDLERTFRRVGEAAMRLGRTLSLSITVPLTAAATAFVVLADKQIQAEAALTNAIRATGREAEISVDALKDFTSELQNVTTFGDEAQLSALALTQQLANLDQAGLQAVLPGMLDFSAAMGVDLQTAASLFGKTLGSSTNALTRYGIELDTAASPTEKLAQLTKALEERFGGAAEAAAAAGLGPFRQMKNAAGDLAEQFGTILLPAVNKVVDVFRGLIDWLSAMDENTKRIILTLGGLAAVLGPVALGIGLVSKAMAAMAVPPAGTIFLVVTAVALLVTGLITLGSRLRGVRGDTDDLKQALRELSRVEQAGLNITFLTQQMTTAQANLELQERLLTLAQERQMLAEEQAQGAGTLSIAATALRRANTALEAQTGLTVLARRRMRQYGEQLKEANAILEETVPAVDDLGAAVRETTEKWRTWQGLMKAGGSDDPFKFITEGSEEAATGLSTLQLQFQVIFTPVNALFNSLVETGGALRSLGAEDLGPLVFLASTFDGIGIAAINLMNGGLTPLEIGLGRVGLVMALLMDDLENGTAVIETMNDAFEDLKAIKQTIIEYKKLNFEIFTLNEGLEKLARKLDAVGGGGDRTPQGPGAFGNPLQPNAGGFNPETAEAFNAALMSAIPELAMLTTTAGLLNLLFIGFTNVVGDLIAGPLATLIGVIVKVGEIFGTFLTPVITLVTDVMMILAGGFVWFYNKVLLKIGNFWIWVMKVFQGVVFVVAQGIVNSINKILELLNRIPGINIGLLTNPITPPSFTDGFLTPISLDDLTQTGFDSGATEPGGGGATFQQQRPIDITINVFDNQVFGGNIQDFAVIIRDEILDITELGL